MELKYKLTLLSYKTHFKYMRFFHQLHLILVKSRQLFIWAVMESLQQEKICYKILVPHYFRWEVRYFMIEKINQIQQLEETIRNICEIQVNFVICWSKPEGRNAYSQIVIKSDAELEAAQNFMMKNCECNQKKKCSGCGEVVFSLIYNRCCCIVLQKWNKKIM